MLVLHVSVCVGSVLVTLHIDAIMERIATMASLGGCTSSLPMQDMVSVTHSGWSLNACRICCPISLPNCTTVGNRRIAAVASRSPPMASRSASVLDRGAGFLSTVG